LHEHPLEALRLAASARRHWERLLDEDRSASDLTPLLQLGCDVLQHVPESERPLPLPKVPSTARSAAGLRSDFAAAAALPPPVAARCWGAMVPPAVVVMMHGSAASESSVMHAHALWEALCLKCSLQCVHGRGGRRPLPNWDVLVEHEATHSAAELTDALMAASKRIFPRPMYLVHNPAAQFPAVFQYSARGATLAAVARGERLRARLPAALAAAGFKQHMWASRPLEPLANGTRGAALDVAWRDTLTALGIARSSLPPLLAVAERLRLRLSADRAAEPLWIGCYRDRGPSRDVANGPRNSGHTTLSCAAACIDAPVFAMANGGQCFCGTSLARATNHSKRVPPSQCGAICEAEEGKLPPRYCGGGARNAVYVSRGTLLPVERSLLMASPPPPSIQGHAAHGELEAAKGAAPGRATRAAGAGGGGGGASAGGGGGDGGEAKVKDSKGNSGTKDKSGSKDKSVTKAKGSSKAKSGGRVAKKKTSVKKASSHESKKKHKAAAKPKATAFKSKARRGHEKKN